MLGGMEDNLAVHSKVVLLGSFRMENIMTMTTQVGFHDRQLAERV